MAARSAEREAAFLLPHLRPGMRLLDAGCGPGTITLGLAAAVAPGEVVGLELSPAMVEQARALAAERGVANVRFEVGDVQALPFPDASFDAAFESAVLEHVPDPARAVAELRRVLRPGGVVGLRDGDWGAGGAPVLEPPDPLVAEAYALVRAPVAAHGRRPLRGAAPPHPAARGPASRASRTAVRTRSGSRFPHRRQRAPRRTTPAAGVHRGAVPVSIERRPPGRPLRLEHTACAVRCAGIEGNRGRGAVDS